MLKLKSWQLGAAVLVVIFGGVLVTTAFGWWQTESTKVPAKYESGETAGEYRPDDIRGSYTFGDISTLFEIPFQDLSVAFHLPEDADPAVFACKDLESLYITLADSGTEIGTASVRLFVALYRGLPYEIEEETYLLRPAVQMLKQKAALTEEQIIYLDAHTVNLGTDEEIAPSGAVEAESQVTPAEEVSASTSVPSPEEHVEENERFIKGKTTFREVLDWGVPQEAVERIIGGPMPNPLTLIKDYCTAQDLEFADIKTALQAEVDAAD